jgi:glycosyltransferase involved in cell wall biosynthesis
MACGTPVVASRVGGIPEIIRDKETGLLVEAGNAADLASAIDVLPKKPERAAEFEATELVTRRTESAYSNTWPRISTFIAKRVLISSREISPRQRCGARWLLPDLSFESVEQIGANGRAWIRR